MSIESKEREVLNEMQYKHTTDALIESFLRDIRKALIEARNRRCGLTIGPVSVDFSAPRHIRFEKEYIH